MQSTADSVFEQHTRRKRQVRCQYSVDRLRNLYSNLLQICIDNKNNETISSNRCMLDSPKKDGDNSNSNIFIRTVLPKIIWSTRQRVSNHHNSNGTKQRKDQLRKRQLAKAFRSMAASRSCTPSVPKDNTITATFNYDNNNTVDYYGDDDNDSTTNNNFEQCVALANELEKKLIDTIRSIGELVVNTEHRHHALRSTSTTTTNGATTNALLRSDDVFEYFCEKSILLFLVDIVKENPSTSTTDNNKHRTSTFHGIVWTPKVKAAVYQTVTMLVSGVQRDASALYYILSQHCINQLILSMIPLQQYTHQALEIILPPYVDLLKTISFQLSSDPDILFPFFTVPDKNKTDAYFFPLFSAIVTVLKSPYSESDSFVHASSLNLTVGLLQVTYPTVRQWLTQNAEREHYALSNHLAQILIGTHRRIVDLTTGPVVDIVRSKAIEAQLERFKHQMDALNDIFLCDIPILNMRICETLLRRFIMVLLQDIFPVTTTGSNRQHCLLAVGVSDSDVLPDRESAAQVATLLLSRTINYLEYGPFARMIAVALIHPVSSTIICNETPQQQLSNNDRKQQQVEENEFTITLQLNSIIQESVNESIDNNQYFIPNPYRNELLTALRGGYGDWRVVTAVFLFESLLHCSFVDVGTLVKLEILPPNNINNVSRSPTSVEDALIHFLSGEHIPTSVISTLSLECASSLALQYLYKSSVSMHMAYNEQGMPGHAPPFLESPLREALNETRSHFYQQTLDSQHAIGVADIFVDVVEAVVQTRYKKYTTKHHDVVVRGYAYNLSQHSSTYYSTNNECLVRKQRGVNWNDVEHTRFYTQMSLHFRAVYNIVDTFHAGLEKFSANARSGQDSPAKQNSSRISLPPLRLVDNAGDLCSVFSCLMQKPSPGTDLDLHGRITFKFVESIAREQEKVESKSSRRNKGNAKKTTSLTDLVLVLDPTDMFVVKLKPKCKKDPSTRGTILCCIPLLNVIAAAQDGGTCLHVAVRNDEEDNDSTNLSHFMKNGNMVFKFEAAGVCSVVKQYLDRSRNLLRSEIMEKIKSLFTLYSLEDGLVETGSNPKEEDDSLQSATIENISEEIQ